MLVYALLVPALEVAQSAQANCFHPGLDNNIYHILVESYLHYMAILGYRDIQF